MEIDPVQSPRLMYSVCFLRIQVVKLHSPSDGPHSVEIGRTEIISNTLNPKFVTIVPVVRQERNGSIVPPKDCFDSKVV